LEARVGIEPTYKGFADRADRFVLIADGWYRLGKPAECSSHRQPMQTDLSRGSLQYPLQRSNPWPGREGFGPSPLVPKIGFTRTQRFSVICMNLDSLVFTHP